jgi:2-polyprenyl-3-methyl-5-hydroxy-6-metoxy-1,4-benzoquinol methylase
MGGEQALTQSANAHERLEPAHIHAGGLLAAAHVHRYELAARLCAGRRVLDLCCGTGYGSRILAREAIEVHGVDISEEALATARVELSSDERERVTFQVADAHAYLRALPTRRFDAIVCFEGIEHVPDHEAVVGELLRLAGDGTRLVLSLPNSRGFDEQNEFHVTDFGYEEMRAVADRFPDAVVLSQYLAEASLVLPPDVSPGAAATGRLVDNGGEGTATETGANHWLILVGGDPPEEVEAGLALAAAPHHNEYMRALERANEELLRANRRLARGWLGLHDAAAAAAEGRRRKIEELEREVEHERAVAKSNHDLMVLQKAALDAPRYRAVDAVRTLAFSIPGVGALLRLRSRLLRRRRERG